MQFSLYTNQAKAIEWGISLNQATLFGYIHQNVASLQRDLFTRLSKEQIIKDLPIIATKKDTVYRLTKVLIDNGLIAKKVIERCDFYLITDKGMSWDMNLDNSHISCNLCRDSSVGAVETMKKYLMLGAQYSVCSGCIANLVDSFSLAHSGTSYFGNSAENNQAAGYRKKTITRLIRKQVFERDAYRCKHCETHFDLTVDHIIPESKGGTLSLSNLQTLCRSCNSSKGVKVGEEI